MSFLGFLIDISKIWQKNDECISGDKWVELQELFQSQVLVQFENKSKKFQNEKIEFSFLPDQSVPMEYRIDEFLSEIFLLENASSFFEIDSRNSCLHLSIEKQKLTSLVAAAKTKFKQEKKDFTFFLKKETKTYQRNTSTVIEDKICKKRQREEQKEGLIQDFLTYKYLQRRKNIPKDYFRCALNDYLVENKIKLYFSEPSLEEVLNRVYPGSVSSTGYSFTLQT